MKQLPLSVSDFSYLRNPAKDYLYVDKTDLLQSMIARSKLVFLARPRRFGKSLLVSTLSELFANGLEKFSGLKIEKTWDDRTYKVMKLDFSRLMGNDSIEGFLQALDDRLVLNIAEAGFDVPETVRLDPVLRWEKFLASLKEDSLVLLVDEYDAPLTEKLHHPDLFEKIRNVISNFFGALKTYSGRFRFVFITGIMRFQQAALFSNFNDIRDISFMALYGGLLGFTEAEIKGSFGPWIEHAAAVRGEAYESVLKRLKVQYDGFCFDSSGKTHVYAPWSVLNFLSYPEEGYDNYWFQSGSGTSALLRNYFRTHQLFDPAKFDRPIYTTIASLRSSSHVATLDDTQILAHTGYLTIKDASPDGMIALGFPNEEVRQSLGMLLKTTFWPSDFERNELTSAFCSALVEKDPQKVLSVLNSIVHHLDYQNFTLTTESAVRQLLQIFCLGGGLKTRIETHSPRGRSDLEISLRQLDVVFEVKHVRNAAEGEKALERALTQIQERDYGNNIPGRDLVRFGIVFAEDARRFCRIGMA
ncbi:AAA family ATPase [uncultured Sutterella sp.]|uniref:AAA family ATPase n=1 Tax=uncultured Sutterella sp. TaxID=286133 RepID=UPI0026050C7E|nr:AAA family ATPase [uncultured Sutterella sp.]